MSYYYDIFVNVMFAVLLLLPLIFWDLFVVRCFRDGPPAIPIIF